MLVYASSATFCFLFPIIRFLFVYLLLTAFKCHCLPFFWKGFSLITPSWKKQVLVLQSFFIHPLLYFNIGSTGREIK